MTGKQDKGARQKINADNDPRSRVSLLNLANHHPQLLILISIQLSSTAETAHAVRCCLALLQVLHSGLAAALSMHVLDALCPHNKNIVLFRLGMEKFLDGQAQSLSNPSKVKI